MTASLIFGASGNHSIRGEDFPTLASGAILASCTSRDVEFDVSALVENYARELVMEGVDMFTRQGQTLYLLEQGLPINFRDGGGLGPILSLVQAEMLLCLDAIEDRRKEREILEIDSESRRKLALIWFDHFCDLRSGVC